MMACTTTDTPKPDRGFYGSVPRIVRTGYREGDQKLTVPQKWLYTCLKDLCGDYNECFRALRTLAGETQLSTGTLSEGIRILVEVGLITATKKKHTAHGQEVWHIKIVDIWPLNAATHPAQKGVQEVNTFRSLNEHAPKGVQQMNTSVHLLNTTPLECSADERRCSPNETEGEGGETRSEGDKKEEDVCTVLPTSVLPEHCFAIAQPAHTSISNDILSDSKPKEAKAAIVSSPSIAPKMETVASSPPPPKGEKPKGSEKPPASGKTGTKLNEYEQRIYDWWCDVVGCEVRITQTVQFRCSEIAPYVQDQDTFKREYAILKRQWRYPDSIKLGNLLDHLKGKQARDQTQHRTPESVQRAATHNKSQIERMKLMIEKRKNGEKDQCAAI